MQREPELPPLGAQVELLLNHAKELEKRFESRADSSYLLSVAWIQKYAKEILDSLPRRRQQAAASSAAS